MPSWTCGICFAHEDEPFQYRCKGCLTTYRPQQVEKDDPANLETHQEQTRCLRQKVQAIGRKFHSGSKFHDATFPRHYCPGKIKRWCRPRALYLCTDPYRRVPWCIHDEPDYTDIEQLKFGHCWFVAALSAMATRHHFVHQLVVSGDKRAGVYGVTLFVNGNWHYIIVDDKLPCKDKYFIPSTIEVRTKQLWPYLAEKALAKIYGSYNRLEGGRFSMGMTHLTGCAPKMLRPYGKTGCMPERQLFEYLETIITQGSVGAVMFYPSNEQKRKKLFGFHVYQLLAAKDLGGNRLVKIRNPWGHTSWLGNWSQQDRANWSTLPEEFRNFRIQAANHMGIFWMHITDFIEGIDVVDSCALHYEWHENACNGRLYDQEQNQIYSHKLIITQPTIIDLFLWTKDMQTIWKTDTEINFLIIVQKEIGNKVGLVFCTQPAELSHLHGLCTSLDQGVYYVYAFGDRILQFNEGAFYTMRSVSDKKVVFQSKVEPVDNLAELIIQLAIARGSRYERDNQDGEIYILEHRDHSLDAIVVINASQDKYLNVMTNSNYSDDVEFGAGRGSKTTEDFLPPSTIQVVNTFVTSRWNEFEPWVSSRYLPVDDDIAECYPPLTPQSSKVHHLVDFKEFTANQLN